MGLIKVQRDIVNLESKLAGEDVSKFLDKIKSLVKDFESLCKDLNNQIKDLKK